MRRIVLNSVLLALAACGSSEVGSGIGRPGIDPNDTTRPERMSLAITEVYVTATNASEWFVELTSTEAPDLDLSDLDLCSSDCIDLTGVTVAEGSRTIVQNIDTIGLRAGVGDVAVVDANGVVHAYVAWGADPSIVRSPWYAAAVASGATTPGDFVPLPFPLSHAAWATSGEALAFAREQDESGCSLASPEAEGTIDAALCALDSTHWGVAQEDCDADPTACAAQTVGVRISELLPAAKQDSDSWVELVNPSDLAVSLDGVRLCQMPSCILFGPGDEIGAHDYLLAHLGVEASGSPDERERFFAGATPVRGIGELVILAPGAAAVSTTELFQSFVRYGTTDGQLSAIATAAGQWLDPASAARPPRLAGESLSADRSGLRSGVAWNPATPTPLSENPDIGEASTESGAKAWGFWDSCSYPRPWDTAPESPVAIQELARGAPSTIRLRNRTASTLALDAWTLALGNETVALSDNAPAAASTSASDEAVARLEDTNVNSNDFAIASATIGAANKDATTCTGVVINELVASPQQDWGGGAEPFDAAPGSDPPDDGDQWIELYNCDGEAVDLSDWVVQIVDASPTTFQLSTVDEANVASTGQVLRFSAGGTVTALGSQEYLVIGVPAGDGDRVDESVTVRLLDNQGQTIDAASFGAELLGPSGELLVELASQCSVGEFCWSAVAGLPANGEASLLDASSIRAHVQWGDPTPVRGLAAETANVWPLETCSTRALGDDDVLSLASGQDGTSPPDYQ